MKDEVKTFTLRSAINGSAATQCGKAPPYRGSYANIRGYASVPSLNAQSPFRWHCPFAQPEIRFIPTNAVFIGHR